VCVCVCACACACVCVCVCMCVRAQYREAYVALSLPRLLAPNVRLEMMDWEPLTDGKSLEVYIYMYIHLRFTHLPTSSRLTDPPTDYIYIYTHTHISTYIYTHTYIYLHIFTSDSPTY